MISGKRSLLGALAVLLVGAAFFVIAAPPEPVGKIAPKPLFRDPVHDGAADPVLIWDHSALKWVVFYTNRRANAPNLAGVTWVHGTRIGIAESSDGGASWKYAGTAAIEFGKPNYTHWAPELLEHEGTYHMYLSIVPGIFANWNAERDIIHLTSKDLRKWQYESTLELGSDRVIDANITRLPDGSWRMWYKNERAKGGSLHYADSRDLYKWTPKGNAIPDVSGEGAKIFRWKDRYWMIVDVWDGLAVFKSDDALNWKRQPENILREPGTQPTDRAKGQHADVVVSGDRAFLFYFTHQSGADAEGKDPQWARRTVIQVAELEYAKGQIMCNRNRPVTIGLAPPH